MSDPFAGGFPGGFDPRLFQNVPLFRELAKVMAWSGGPVNWELARQSALAVVAPDEDDPVDARDSEAFAEAVDVAELWLDAATVLARVPGPARVLSRAEWVRMATTSDGLGMYVEPVAEAMSGALGRAVSDEAPALGGQLGGLGGQLEQAMRSLGAMLYGLQIGTVAGHLAGQLLATYDLGLPTVDPRVVAPVGDAATRFAADYGFEQTEFRYWLALRDAAHRRQFAGVPWLRGYVRDLVARFAADADLDAERLMEQFGTLGLDPNMALENPQALQEALERPDAFRVEPTPAQQATLAQLQALVAFTAGWVDTVVAAAAAERLVALPRIDEALRRRRAERGRGEQFLQQLIGLDLKPSDVRLGQSFCQAVVAARGQEGLDRAWHSAEHLPSAGELSDPSRWLVRMAAREMDAGGEQPS